MLIRNTYKNHNGKPNLQFAAHIITQYRHGADLRVMNDMITANYETLLRILEDAEIEREVSNVMGLPGGKIREIAESIIDILLYNSANDAYASLGLRKDVSGEKAHERWKRLITLYHPDKQGNSKIYEERAKRINEAFAAINESKKADEQRERSTTSEAQPRAGVRIGRKYGINMARNERFKYLRHLPTLILVLSVVIAVFMLSFCIYKVSSNSSRKEKPVYKTGLIGSISSTSRILCI